MTAFKLAMRCCATILLSLTLLVSGVPSVGPSEAQAGLLKDAYFGYKGVKVVRKIVRTERTLKRLVRAEKAAKRFARAKRDIKEIRAAETVLNKVRLSRSVSKDVRVAERGRAYLKEIKQISGDVPARSQRRKVYDCLRNPEDCLVTDLKHKARFKGVRNKVVQEWEQNTGRSWPTYQRDVFNAKGTRIKKRGDSYEAHHIIPKDRGGPHEWWNMHPLPVPEHQRVIHGAQGALNLIMKALN